MSTTGQSETDSLESVFRKYAWDYFAIHAAQRLACFQFFITLATAMVGGFLLLIRNTGSHKWMAVFGLLLTLLSFVFLKLDNRTRQLVKKGEEALKYLDDLHQLPDLLDKRHPLRVFSRDDDKTRVRKLDWSFGHFSYTDSFRIVFIAFGTLGLLGAALSLASSPFSEESSNAYKDQSTHFLISSPFEQTENDNAVNGLSNSQNTEIFSEIPAIQKLHLHLPSSQAFLPHTPLKTVLNSDE